MEKKLALWQPDSTQIIPKGTNAPSDIIPYAQQLTKKDQKQLASAFSQEHFEMGLLFLWQKTLSALKTELSSVGISLLSEMLGKTDIDEDSDVEDILTPKETIKLAEELGAVTATDALRLRHTHELLNHFNKNQTDEELDETEALNTLKICIKSVLGRPKVEVASKFVEFREALENETLSGTDPRVETLSSSPYFFQKLSINILLNASKNKKGAQLENSLANLNTILPLIWGALRDTEKWQVGKTYSEIYNDGQATTLAGLKSALLKVKGFDFVQENIRSATFLKAAESIVHAHEGMNNFYNEPAPVRNLVKLGSTIPTPALPACMTALLCVSLGNRYGTSWDAKSVADSTLEKLSPDRWQFYLNQVLPSDTRILEKFQDSRPRSNWYDLVHKFNLQTLTIKNKTIEDLIKSSAEKNDVKTEKTALKLKKEYYGTPL